MALNAKNGTPYTLYHNLFSVRSIMIRWLLEIRGEPKDEASRMDVGLKEVDIFHEGQFSEWFLCEINKNGEVPVLGSDVVFDHPMPHTTAISAYICDRYPQLLPAQHAATIRDMIHKLHGFNFFIISFRANPAFASRLADGALKRLEDTSISAQYREALANKADAIRREKVEPLTPERIQTELDKVHAFLQQVATLLDPEKGSWLLGEQRPTELDAHLVPWILRLHDVGRDSIIPEPLREYQEKAVAEPSFQTVMRGRSTLIG